jgi:hypothetical protein
VLAVEADEMASAEEEIARRIRLERGPGRLHYAAARIVNDELRRAARVGRLPEPGSAALVRSVRERLIRLGLEEPDLQEGAREALAALEACLADPQLQWIFSPAHTHIESPCPLTGLHEGRLTQLTLDRAFIDAQGERWVVRYDALDVETRAAAWLERVRSLARALGPQPCRAGIYDPLARALRELR